MHRLNVEGSIPLESDDGYDYAALGESIVASENRTVTPYGVLVINGLHTEDLYNSKTFPQFFYEECLMSVTLRHGNDYEFLYMPCSENAIDRALCRLGAASLDECELLCIDSELHIGWLDKLSPGYDAADILYGFASERRGR